MPRDPCEISPSAGGSLPGRTADIGAGAGPPRRRRRTSPSAGGAWDYGVMSDDAGTLTLAGTTQPETDLEDAYTAAWQEWEDAGEAEAWAVTVADGVK